MAGNQESLEIGEQFDKAFMLAISKSVLCVPIVSLGALERMRTLSESDDVDNVLLEWSLMMCLESKKIVKRVSPIFVSPNDTASLFKAFKPLSDLPNVVAGRTYEVLRKFVCEELGHAEPPPRRTVAQLIDGMFKYNTNLQSWSDNSGDRPHGGESVYADPAKLHESMDQYVKYAKTIIQSLSGLLEETGTAGKRLSAPLVSPFQAPVASQQNPPLGKMSVEEVSQLLTEHSMGNYVQLFKQEGINGITFKTLTAEDLVEMGIPKFHAKELILLRDENL